MLSEIIAAGYFVSTTPSLAYSPQSRQAIAQAPIERLLIETDSPVFYQENDGMGFQATPKDVFRTLKAYAQLKNFHESEVLEIVNHNAKNFFGI